MERILGIDYGDARVGIAISDLMGLTAQGVETIHHKGNEEVLLNRIEELINGNRIIRPAYKNVLPKTKYQSLEER